MSVSSGGETSGDESTRSRTPSPPAFVSPPSPMNSTSSFVSGPVGLVAPDTVERLGQRIMAIILGNLSSEALWETKQSTVAWLGRITDPKHAFSTRAELKRIGEKFRMVNQNSSSGTSFIEASAQSWVLVGLFGIGMATYPQLCFYMSVLSCSVLLVAYVLDEKILFMFKLHRPFMDDDTFVAAGLILILVYTFFIVASSFTLLVLRDARTAADLMQQSIEENLFGSEWVKETMQGLSLHGKNAMHEYVDVLEDQYLKNSTWAPLLRWTVSYADNFTASFAIDENEKKELGDMWSTNWTAWPTPAIPDMKEFTSMAQDFYASNSEMVSQLGDLSGTVKENVFTMFAMSFSVVFLIVDFGVRIAFFITFLFILLSSKETILHEFLSGFMEKDYDPSTSTLALFEIQLRSVIEAVLMMPVKMGFLNALATLLLFWMFGIQLMFFAASLNLLITIFPIITPFWICLPWIIAYYANNTWTLGWCILVFSVNYIMFYLVNMWVLAGFGNKFHRSNSNHQYSASSMDSQDDFSLDEDSDHEKDTMNDLLVVGKREYLTGLSVFFGLTAFGAKGALLGPIVVCLALVMYNVIKAQQQHVYRDNYFGNHTAASNTPNSTPSHPQRTKNDRRMQRGLNRSFSSAEMIRSEQRETFHDTFGHGVPDEGIVSSDNEVDDAILESMLKPISSKLRNNTKASSFKSKLSASTSTTPSKQIPRLKRSNSTIEDLTNSSLNLLDYFSRTMSPSVANRTSSTSATTSIEHNNQASEDILQEKLKRLLSWSQDGLISNEDYEDMRSKLLSMYIKKQESFTGPTAKLRKRRSRGASDA